MADAPATVVPHSQEFLDERAALIRKTIQENTRKQLLPFELEAMAYNDLRFGSPLRAVFLLEMMKLQWGHDPLIFSADYKGDKNDWAYRQINRFCCEKFPVFMGAGSCISGDTKILNPITGMETPVRELYEKGIAPVVMTLAGPAQATVPFIKGVETLYEVKLSNGRSFTSTKGHRVLDSSGKFVQVGSLCAGGKLLLGYEHPHQCSVPSGYKFPSLSHSLLPSNNTDQWSPGPSQIGEELDTNETFHGPNQCIYSKQALASLGFEVSGIAVESITEVGEQEYFDLLVPNVHHYFCEGAIHHNSGKSYILSACAYTAWKAKPWATSVFFSTTSGEAAEQRGWGYMKNFFRNDRCPVGAVLLEYKKSIVLEENVKSDDKSDRDFRNSIHLVMIKPGNEGDNALAAISGRKNEVVIWLKDESQLMTNDTTIAELNLITNPFCQIIDLGNAPKEGTQFYETAKPFGPGFEDGFRSIDTETMTGWPTRSGYCEWFDGEKSPNLRYEGAPPFKGIISRESILEIERRSGGRDTPGFWVQVKGFPHSADVSDTVLTQDMIKSNLADAKAVWKGSPLKVLGGGDLGFRVDGDPCMATFGKLGECSDGVKRLEVEAHSILITPSKDSKLSFEDQIALKFIEECNRRGCTEFELDISGDGGKIYGSCLKLSQGRINFIPTSFMGSPEDVPIGNGDTRLCSEVYGKMVTQLWMNTRSAVIAGVIRGMSLQSAMTSQFCARKVIEQNSGKKQDVEVKKEMKKRIKRSPDDADSCVLLVNNARRQGLSAALVIVDAGGAWEDEEAEKKIIPYQVGGFAGGGYRGSGGRSAYSSR